MFSATRFTRFSFPAMPFATPSDAIMTLSVLARPSHRYRPLLLLSAALLLVGHMNAQSLTQFINCVGLSGSGTSCSLSAGNYSVTGQIIIQRPGISVSFANGTVSVSSPILLQATGVTISGASSGQGTTTLTRASGYNGQIIMFDGNYGPYTGVTITSITFDGTLTGGALPNGNTNEILIANTAPCTSYPTDAGAPHSGTCNNVTIINDTILNPTFISIGLGGGGSIAGTYPSQGILIKNVNILAANHAQIAAAPSGTRVGPAFFGIWTTDHLGASGDADCKAYSGYLSASGTWSTINPLKTTQYIILDDVYITNIGVNAIFMNSAYLDVINSAFVNNGWDYTIAPAGGAQLGLAACSYSNLIQNNSIIAGGFDSSGNGLSYNEPANSGYTTAGIETEGLQMTFNNNYITNNSGTAFTLYDTAYTGITNANGSMYIANNNKSNLNLAAISFSATGTYGNQPARDMNTHLTVQNVAAINGQAWGVYFANSTSASQPFSFVTIQNNCFSGNTNTTNSSVGGWSLVTPANSTLSGNSTTPGCTY